MNPTPISIHDRAVRALRVLSTGKRPITRETSARRGQSGFVFRSECYFIGGMMVFPMTFSLLIGKGWIEETEPNKHGEQVFTISSAGRTFLQEILQ